MKTKSKLGLQLMVAALVAGPIAASAVEPIDLSAAGTTLAGYVASAGALGVGVFIAIMGIRVIKRAFKSAAS